MFFFTVPSLLLHLPFRPHPSSPLLRRLRRPSGTKLLRRSSSAVADDTGGTPAAAARPSPSSPRPPLHRPCLPPSPLLHRTLTIAVAVGVTVTDT